MAAILDIKEDFADKHAELEPCDTGNSQPKALAPVVMEEDREMGSIMPEGGYGWLVVLASFLAHFIINGTHSAYGVFLQHYVNTAFKGRASTTTLSMVGTLQAASMSLFGMMGGAMADRFGYRTTMFIGIYCY